jgi:lysozyme
MQINAAGLALIKEFEGLRLAAYLCPAGVATIGYGTTVYPDGRRIRVGDEITQQQAEDYLRNDLRAFEREVERMVLVPVNENQFSALVSFAYNCGAQALQKSTLLRYINAHEFVAAAGEFARWNQAAGKVLPGLVRRRAAERELFTRPVTAPAVPPPPVAMPEPTPEPVQEPVQEQPKEWSFNMAPIVAALLPALINLLPEIGKLFGSGPKTQQNLVLAEKVAGIVTQAVGATNLQGAIESVQADPALRQRAADALQSRWYELVEIGGGIQAAREFSARTAADGASFIRMPAFWISLALLPLLYGTVYAVLTGGDGFTSELRAAIASSVVTGVLGAVAGFWLGSSFTTSRSRGLNATPASDQP